MNVFDVSNVLERTYPIGMDTQVFSTFILNDIANLTDDPEDREHVSLYIYRNPEIFRLKNLSAPPFLQIFAQIFFSVITHKNVILSYIFILYT